MTIKSFINKWNAQGVEDWGGVTSPSYKQFQTEYKKIISEMCKGIGFVLHSFSGKHYEFSAVVKNVSNGRFYYISISDVRYFSGEWHTDILYRTMAHDKDWKGGYNNYSTLERLGENLLRLDRFENK